MISSPFRLSLLLVLFFLMPIPERLFSPSASSGNPGRIEATAKTMAFFKEQFQQLRKQAQEARQPKPLDAEGWSKSDVDPMKTLAVFDSLRMKKGLTLRAYRFTMGNNGEGVVWAMPADVPFPEPQERRDPMRSKPPHAMDALAAIDGDGSPWSYLCGSLLQRELEEFGAMWHCQNWCTHMILWDDPWKPGQPAMRDQFSDQSLGRPEQWQWSEAKPTQWQPEVHVEKDGVTVIFFTHSSLGQQTIYRHVDKFKPGSYQFMTERTVLAKGPGVMVF